MKILVVSLLRIGDLVMCGPVINSLKKRYPHAEIDLLTNDSNRGVVPLIKNIRKTFWFTRDRLQKGLGEADQPIFASLDTLKSLIDDLNTENYDQVINLTQTKISGYLCALIHASEKNGLVIGANENASFGSPWFRHLNDFAEVDVQHLFHFIDIFKAGSGVGAVDADFGLNCTENGEAEIAKVTDGPFVAVQPFTSDEKKNWHAEKWIEFLVLFSRLQPEVRLLVLGASSDKSKIDAIVTKANSEGARAETSIMSLEGVYSLMKRAALCVSVDTSVKHLAAAAGASVVELVFGSSDYRRTGGYSSRTLIVRSKEKCQPCAHSRPCHREQRFCSRVSAVSVASLAAQFYRKDQISLRSAASELSDELECYLGKFSAGGFWWPENISVDDHGQRNSAYLLELFAWKILLQREHLERVVPYGAHLRAFKDSMQPVELSAAAMDRLMRNYIEKSHHVSKLQSDLVKLLRSTLLQQDQSGQIENDISELEKRLEWRNYLVPRWRELSGHGLGQVRQVQRLLNEVEQLQQIRIKMLQSLRELPRETL